MPPIEIKLSQTAAISVDDEPDRIAGEAVAAPEGPLELDKDHDDDSSSTTSSSASDESARGSDVEGVEPVDGVDHIHGIKQGNKVHVVRNQDDATRPVPWCRDMAFTQDAKSEGHGFFHL